MSQSDYGDISQPWESLVSELLRLPPPFVDERGVIQPVLDRPVRSCVYITCEPGAIRGNHYHREDWHYAFVVTGSMMYYSRPVGSLAAPRISIIEAGNLVFTPPGVEHAMSFVEATTFFALGNRSRQQSAYEADLVRVQLLGREHSA